MGNQLNWVISSFRGQVGIQGLNGSSEMMFSGVGVGVGVVSKDVVGGALVVAGVSDVGAGVVPAVVILDVEPPSVVDTVVVICPVLLMLVGKPEEVVSTPLVVV